VKASLALKAEAEDTSADFSPEEGRVDVRPIPTLEVDRALWADRLRRVSRLFLASRDVLESTVTLDVGSGARYLASTDGTRLALPDPQARLMIYAATRSDDGMELFRYESWEARSMEGLPDEAAMEAAARKVLEDLQALRAAPVVEPFTGPAILSGSAAAVFFHEIFGHRIEGHRQKSDDEGQTFTKKVGQSVLPPFLSVADDPGQTAYRGVDLMGHYLYDNEGVPGRRAEVVVDGVLRGFLMSRSPVSGFDRSNGHGRRQPGFPPVGRQGNLVVTSRQTLAAAELRARLKELLRKQGKAFGLYFADISGGFTFTNRDAPQAFKVLPIMVYRVFPDDRPDELVRGVDIVGTPLASFSRIVATGGEPEVFNGYCGAESGYIPVSAVAPSILVSEMEIEKRAKGVDRPPILDAPGAEGRR
jgi:predicted Zn-dependent protease